MTYELTTSNRPSCGCGTIDVFIINGKEADCGDFGECIDIAPEMADDYGCGNMSFMPYTSDADIHEAMSMYGITEDEFNEIADKLSEMLHIGKCDMCS